MGTASSFDGLRWANWTSAAGMEVQGDTSNNALWDEHLRQYLGFSRLDTQENTKLYGLRKESISLSSDFRSWKGHAVCLRGTVSGTLDGEAYALVPFRLPSWRAGLYLGLGAFYDASGPPYRGIVTNELLRSTNFGNNWTRLTPGKAFIPHGKTLDNHTTYAARVIPDPHDVAGSRLLMYYAGGDGPHSGRRRNYIMLATAEASELVGLGSSDGRLAVVETVPLLQEAAENRSGLTLRLRFDRANGWVSVAMILADGSTCAQGEASAAAVDANGLGSVHTLAVRLADHGGSAGCAGRAVSLRFELASTVIYSFAFGTDLSPSSTSHPGLKSDDDQSVLCFSKPVVLARGCFEPPKKPGWPRRSSCSSDAVFGLDVVGPRDWDPERLFLRANKY